MSRFPPTIPRKSRLLLGLVGILLVLLVWSVLTWPFLEETTTRRTSKIGPDGIVSYEEVPETRERALVNPPALASPWDTFARAFRPGTDGQPSLAAHMLASTRRIVLGFLLSTLLAVPLGVALALFPRARAMAAPVISFFRPLPSIAWVPLAVIWFGIDETQKLAILFMGTFFAALVYTIEATLRVPPELIQAARNLGTSNRQLLSRVLLPAALPSILAGLRVVLAICWTCVISAEIVAANRGLGSMIWFRGEANDTEAVMLGIVSISAIVLLMDGAFSLLERRLVPWTQLAERDA